MDSKKITINGKHAHLIAIGIIHAPIQGLTLSMLEKVQNLKKLISGVTNGEMVELDIPADQMPILRASMEPTTYPLGMVPRFDDLVDLFKHIGEQLAPKE